MLEMGALFPSPPARGDALFPNPHASNRLRGHGTCGRPPPPFHPPAGAAPAPPVAELGVVTRRLPSVFRNVSSFIRYFIAVAGIGMLHSVILYAVAILSFIGSFGAPQGGDAPSSSAQLAQRAAAQPYLEAFQRLLDFVLAVLSWPGRLFGPLSPASAAWIATSLFWGLLIVATFLLIARPKHSHATRTNVA